VTVYLPGHQRNNQTASTEEEWFLVKPRDGVEPFVWRNYCPRCESDGRAEMVRRNVEQR
jgi:hypothetical protein